MKIAIVGSRDYPYLELVAAIIRELPSDTIIVSGGARGADSEAEAVCRKLGIKAIIYRPDWSKGKHAGLLRNSLIVENSHAVICFWDGVSTGCIDTVKKAKKAGIPYTILGPKGEVLR